MQHEKVTTLTLARSALAAIARHANGAKNLLSGHSLKRNVKRSGGGQMMLRPAAASVLEAVKSLRRLPGHVDIPRRLGVLRARDPPSLDVSVEAAA
jgi:hypothetical protein